MTNIPSFAGGALRVSAQPPTETTPAMVVLSHLEGGMSFVHAMLPHQAMALVHAVDRYASIAHGMQDKKEHEDEAKPYHHPAHAR